MGGGPWARPSWYRRLAPTYSVKLYRGLHSSCTVWSGHNRWSKIKHDKGKEDAAKSKARSILSKDVALASKLGGPDPNFNPRLASAIANAKRGALSKASIESAIAKGQGKSTSGAPLETVIIEAMLPHSVAAVIECYTDQKLRVLHDIRYIISRGGGTVTPTSFLFEKIGSITFEKRDGITAESMLDDAIEAGATDVELDEEGRLVVDTDPIEVSKVAQQLTEVCGLKVKASEIIYKPTKDMMVSVDEKNSSDLDNIIAQIEEESSVQSVYINAA